MPPTRHTIDLATPTATGTNDGPYYFTKTVTVSELIAALQQCPGDAAVWTEGCDCMGDVAEVKYEAERNRVYLNRERD